MQLYLFGSVARNTHNTDSDIDIIAFNAYGMPFRQFAKKLSKHALEAGGKLDLFVPGFNRLNAVYDPGRVIFLSSKNWPKIKKEMKPIKLDDLITMLEKKQQSINHA
ncbi:MAG: nucleotidyltransferase domain-containing protein [Clostridiales bacterium]|nr:nucleotidyltransferase domain-containing protein [Clostridiales bacterium]MCF8022056.1 nucleotidyltransferase domain-containing protein [Clostridiales bacterium]